MLLPFFLDLIPTWIARLYARLARWQPEGAKVELVVEETPDPEIFGARLTGRLGKVGMANGWRQSVELELDTPLTYQTGTFETLRLLPRFPGHDFYRLLVTSSDVDVTSVGHLWLFGAALHLRK